jgi:hypothetical protein
VNSASWQKEQISKAYVLAVATKAGVTIGEWNVDKDGVDVTLRRRQLMVDLQLKCTGSARTSGGDYAFDLDVPTFAKLTYQDRSAPAYLCLLIVPKTLQAWLHHQPEALLLRCHGYWARMSTSSSNAPPDTGATAIRLPRTNRLDSEALEHMFEESLTMARDGRSSRGGG